MAETVGPISPILSEGEVQKRRQLNKMINQASQNSAVSDAQLALDKNIFDAALPKQEAQQPAGYTPEDDELRQALVESQGAESKSMDDLIADWNNARNEELGRINAKVEGTKKASIFSGAAEAAAALANLIGTTQGATSQQWQSPQSALQARIDQAIAQRDSATSQYNSTISALKQKRGALDAQHTLALAKFDKDRQAQALAERKLENQNAIAEARMYLNQIQQLRLLAKGTADEKKYEMEEKLAQQKYNNLVSQGQRIQAQTRKAEADALGKEMQNYDMYGVTPGQTPGAHRSSLFNQLPEDQGETTRQV